MKAYGFRCNKCDRVVNDTRNPYLAYAPNADEACEKGLQDAIKEHDILHHGADCKWPDFKILVFYTKRKRR